MFIELSYIMVENSLGYPDAEKDKFIPIKRQSAGSHCNTTYIHHFSHAGSHVDAPFHYDSNGKTIDAIPLEDFIYEKPFIVNCPKESFGMITLDDLKKEGMDKLKQADLIMFRTGFSRFRNADPGIYRFQFPGIEFEMAKYLREELVNVKAIMIDFLSVDTLIENQRGNSQIHVQFLSGSASSKRPILIFEEINLESVYDKDIKRIFALPVRFKGLDGSPVVVVAEIS